MSVTQFGNLGNARINKYTALM